MQKRKIGRSELAVAPLGLGGNVFGWSADDKASFAVLDGFVAAGFNLIDTADVYSAWVPGHQGGESETIIGKWMKARGNRDRIVLTTKVGSEMGPGKKGLSSGYITSAVEASLKRLQTDYIDVYQVHRLDPHTPIEETMYSLDQIVRSGKVRYIGGSTMPAYKFAQMIMVADWKGYARPIAMQNLYNLIQREEEREMNRLCHEQGVGLIPYSPLARGFLAGNRSKEGGGITERSKNDTVVQAGTYRDCDWEIVKRLKKIAKAHGVTPAQAALAWLLHKPYMGAPIIGATDLDQLTTAAKATDVTLTAEECKSLEEPYQFRVSPAN